MKNLTTIYTLPEYWASALINNDFSGLSEQERQQIDDFLSSIDGSCVECSNEPFFQWGNDATKLGASCLKYTFIS